MSVAPWLKLINMFEAAADTEAPQRVPSSENHMGSRLESLRNNRFVFLEKILALAQCENSEVQTGEQIGVLARLPKLNLFGIRMQRLRRLHELQKPTSKKMKKSREDAMLWHRSSSPKR